MFLSECMKIYSTCYIYMPNISKGDFKMFSFKLGKGDLNFEKFGGFNHGTSFVPLCHEGKKSKPLSIYILT